MYPEPPDNGGDGGYNCKTDGVLIAAAGIAFATLAGMADPLGILVAGFWEGFSLWGSVAAAGWGLDTWLLVISMEGNIKWLYTNIDHITAPFGILLSFVAIYFGYQTRKKRRGGVANYPKWLVLLSTF